jgi:hypothetical protein
VPPSKAEKIDQSAFYPCPCRRQGELAPITLTDALGCQLCQQIFVVKPDGYALEQLVNYPYRQTWYWNGQQWQVLRNKLLPSYWLVIFCFIFLVLIFALLIIFSPNYHPPLLWLVAAIVFLALISMLQTLLSSRR